MVKNNRDDTTASVPRVQQKSAAPQTSASLPRVKTPSTSKQYNKIERARLPSYQHTPFTATRNMHLQLLTLLSDAPIKRPKTLPMHRLSHIFDIDTGRKESIDSLLQKNHLRWSRSLSNEWGRLSQGNKFGVKATDTIDFIGKNDVPQGAKVTYASFVCDHRPLKPEQYRVRIVVGGDKLTYAYDSGSPAASLLETKLILNSTISDCDKGSRFFTADVKDFFLATPMKDAEYMKVPLKYFPTDIIDKYNLRNLVTHDKYIFIKIKKGMYGLKQAAVLAYKQLVKNLGNHGYYPVDMTNGIWRHVSRRTRFCLCVDDFGVKTFGDDDTKHLLQTLKNYYTISTDMSGSDYCGLHIDWNYDNKSVQISMPGYIESLLQKLNHKCKKFSQHSPHKWTQLAYGKKRQYAIEDDNLPVLDKKGTKKVQSIVGSLLY